MRRKRREERKEKGGVSHTQRRKYNRDTNAENENAERRKDDRKERMILALLTLD